MTTKILKFLSIVIFLSASFSLYAQTNVVPDDVEFQALKALYDNTNGTGWTSNTNWPIAGNWPATATAAQMGTWFGITVTNGDITKIDIKQNNLIGPIPSALGNLTKLTHFYLSGNKINGSIPSTLGNLTNLLYLFLDGNQLTGTIPSSLGNLPLLTQLYLANNQLSGSVPVEFGNLTNLQQLFLNNNQLTGTIPSSLGNLNKLILLYLSANQLTGNIPSTFVNLSWIRYIVLTSNNFSGTLPDWLGNIPTLQGLYFGSNQFSGKIPSSLGNLPALLNLTLDYNQLTGSIPSSLGSLTTLQYLSLRNNLLTGSIPSALGNLPNLIGLYLNFNKLSGSIPITLGNLTNLQSFMLNDNELTGEFPSTLGSLTKLTNLYLFNNKLSGTLPASINNLVNLSSLQIYGNSFTGELPEVGNLSKLAYFMASGNQFTGSIPSSFASLSKLYFFYVSNNKLTGEFPSMQNWIDINSIDISGNNFTGPFPTSVGNCLKLIFLQASNNKFTSLPVALLNLPVLNQVYFYNNELISIPAFQNHVNKSNLTLNITNNHLDVSHLQPIVTAGLKSFTYQLQSIKDVSAISLSVGQSLTIPSRPSGQNSTIFWEKQSGNGTWSSVNSFDEDTSLQTFFRSNGSINDEGIYRWRMTNSSLTGLNLYSNPIEVKTPERFTIDNLAFQYKYDGRKRMIAKKVPGAEWVYMVYDDRDRLVLTQDAEQRKLNKWSFTKYDELNRPILTGIRDTTVYLSQAQMQSVVNAHFTKPSARWSETFIGNATGNVHGYSNKAYPVRTGTTTTEVDANKYLTITYFDNYSFRSLWPSGYNYINDGLAETVNSTTYNQPATEFSRVSGQITGTKTKVLDGGNAGGFTFLKSVNYYDDKYRVIQTTTDNYQEGTERVSMLYDFTGKALKTIQTHVEGNIIWKDLIGATVDGNRLLKTTGGSNWNTSGAASTQQLAPNTDGWIEWTAQEKATSRVIGLSNQNVNNDPLTIQYGLYLRADATVHRYESGSDLLLSGSYTIGDVFRIERVNGTINYRKNGVIISTSPTPTTSALLVDVSLYSSGGTVPGIQSSFSITNSTITRTFNYDHAGRLLKTWHSVNGATPVLLAQNEYNELGQLVDKKLYSTDNGSNFKQSVDYRYNIRGWLTSINNGQLITDNSNDETNDLFGMNLHYNDLVSGLTTTSDAQYNGNISAIQYSNNQALGTVKSHGYKFGYDPMNRLLSATHKERTGAWNASGSYHEDNLSYDLNGNIKSLSRRGENASLMDILSYDYGTGSSASNKLLSVSDTGDKTKGFIDGNIVGDDYTYDANGNMVVDKNKSIITSTGTAGIIYNHLNLPERVTKSSGDYIKYIYDATGRKLSQQIFNSINIMIKKTDYVGEFIYENDLLQFINHEEGRIVGGITKQIAPSTQLIQNNDPSTTTGYTWLINSTSVSISNETIGQENYLKTVSNMSTSTPGVVTDYISVRPGKAYQYRFKGYRTSTPPVYLYIGTEIGNNITPASQLVPQGPSNETVVSIDFTVPANVTRIRVGAVWSFSGTVGDIIYLNKIELFEKGDGGLYTETDIQTGVPNEYQYNMKDHLGNVRMTFTTKDDIQVSTATLETANVASEQGKFLNYDEAIKINSLWFDHSHRIAGGASNTTQYATRLTGGNTNATIGLAKSLSVMPGDKIDVEVFAKYLDPNPNNLNQALKDFITSIATGGGAPGGTIIDGGFAGSLGNNVFPFAGFFTHSSESSTSPKAYLNYLVFDRNYVFKTGGYKRVTTAAIETGTDGLHERLYFDGVDQIKITEPGYVYIWLSNENETAVEVYFDDFKVTHTKSPVIATNDYYPFGLTFNSYQRENAVPNQYKFTGKEEQNELSLNLIDFGIRMYDPAIARWMVIDPLAHKIYGWSPYNYAINNPVLFVDPDGALPWPVHIRSFINSPTTGGGAFRGDGRGASTAGYPTATSRVRSSFTVDPAKGTVSNLAAKQDFTLFYGASGPNGGIPPMVKEGKPKASITNVSSSEGTTSFDFSHSGKDPITPSFVTPALDVHSSLSVTEDLAKGQLTINGSFTGDSFPSTEAFVVDQSGNSKVFLGAKQEEGGISDLFGDNKQPLFKVNIQIQFDSKGNFTGVQQGDKKYSVNEWNKFIQDAFKKK
jgi:RHS repeat-associated protein